MGNKTNTQTAVQRICARFCAGSLRWSHNDYETTPARDGFPFLNARDISVVKHLRVGADTMFYIAVGRPSPFSKPKELYVPLTCDLVPQPSGREAPLFLPISVSLDVKKKHPIRLPPWIYSGGDFLRVSARRCRFQIICYLACNV